MANISGPEASHSLPNLQICIFQAGPLVLQQLPQSKWTWELTYNKFHLNWVKNFFSVRVTEHWERLSRRIVAFPSLEIFESHVEKIWAACGRRSCFSSGAGLDGLQRSLPAPTLLWFRDLRSWQDQDAEHLGAGGSIAVFQVFLFKACGGHSAIAEVLKGLMYVLYTGKNIFFYSWNHTDCIWKPLVFNTSSEKFLAVETTLQVSSYIQEIPRLKKM